MSFISGMEKLSESDSPFWKVKMKFEIQGKQYVLSSWFWERDLKIKRLKKDNFQCQKCGRKDNLQVHHLTYPATSLEDLETLCIYCHEIITGRVLNPQYTINTFHSLAVDKQLKFKEIYGSYELQLEFKFVSH